MDCNEIGISQHSHTQTTHCLHHLVTLQQYILQWFF